jgi:hypothetical protein
MSGSQPQPTSLALSKRPRLGKGAAVELTCLLSCCSRTLWLSAVTSCAENGPSVTFSLGGGPVRSLQPREVPGTCIQHSASARQSLMSGRATIKYHNVQWKALMQPTFSPLVHATLQGDIQVCMLIRWQATCCMAQGLEPIYPAPTTLRHAKKCITLSKPTLVSSPTALLTTFTPTSTHAHPPPPGPPTQAACKPLHTPRPSECHPCTRVVTCSSHHLHHVRTQALTHGVTRNKPATTNLASTSPSHPLYHPTTSPTIPNNAKRLPIPSYRRNPTFATPVPLQLLLSTHKRQQEYRQHLLQLWNQLKRTRCSAVMCSSATLEGSCRASLTSCRPSFHSTTQKSRFMTTHEGDAAVGRAPTLR